MAKKYIMQDISWCVKMKDKALKFLDNIITTETTEDELDIIKYIKQAIECQKQPKICNCDKWEEYFEKLWAIYPRKVDKVLAKKTFEHKIRGLNDSDCYLKCRQIWVAQKKYIAELEANETELQYIKHYSSWLNATIPNSKNYKGR